MVLVVVSRKLSTHLPFEVSDVCVVHLGFVVLKRFSQVHEGLFDTLQITEALCMHVGVSFLATAVVTATGNWNWR